MARLALLAAILVSAFPGQALAQSLGPFAPPVEDYGPGITLAGVGFAPRGEVPRATARAVADARARAEAVAIAMGVTLGEVRAVETRLPFEPRRECRPGEDPRRCSALEAVSADVTFAIAGSPTSDEGARELSATGTDVAVVDAPRRTNASIRHGLRAARLAGTPDAAIAARTNAEAAAAASGIVLGPLFSVVEQINPYGYDLFAGAFGPGRFCIRRRQVSVQRDPDTGRRRVVRGKRVLRCLRLRTVAVRLEATYLGA